MIIGCTTHYTLHTEKGKKTEGPIQKPENITNEKKSNIKKFSYCCHKKDVPLFLGISQYFAAQVESSHLDTFDHIDIPM